MGLNPLRYSESHTPFESLLLGRRRGTPLLFRRLAAFARRPVDAVSKDCEPSDVRVGSSLIRRTSQMSSCRTESGFTLSILGVPRPILNTASSLRAVGASCPEFHLPCWKRGMSCL